ncbi:PAS domain S-box protein [Gudongella oleilytica]|uniref:GGDEF domain-containing response regulator n=1 Tax=Gudongella oleilytica TaxID=1582259 RepID=UPI000FF8853E|nr:PAS domain S-box protein [Gudongella oleilytica]NSW92552.1 PAS domain S-box protein [Bacillota bacterium]
MEINIVSNKKKILLVEDSRLTALIAVKSLQSSGYDVETAATGEEAVQKASGASPPDLVLMDIELAGKMDGIEAARRILKTRDIPVVFLTANTSGEILEKIKEVKAYGFVLKGIDKAAMLSTIEMAIKLHEANSHAGMFERLFEKSLDELYIFHPESLKFVAVNRAARNNLGYTSEELKTMTPLDLKPEFNLESFRKLLQPLLSGEQEQLSFTTIHRRKDGTHYPVEISLQLTDYRGEKFCLTLVVDLTERRKMEDELKEREEILSAITGTARDAIVLLDSQGNVMFWNRAAEKLFGYSREEIMGKDLHRLVVPDERLYKVHRKAFRRFQSTGQGNAIGKTIELKAKRKDGREIDVELSLSALKFRNGWHAVGIVRDIRERKWQEEENRRREERLRMMLEGIPSPAWLVSRERRILAQNKAAKSLLGTKIGDYCWKGIHGGEYLTDKYRELFKKKGLLLPGAKCYFCRGDEALDKNEPINSEVELAGNIWDTWWIPLGEDIYLHYATDVTKYKKMEEELRHLSVVDVLTNAYNRRYFTQKLEEEIERARRTDGKFSLVMLDIDRFKRINDNFGHNAGDLVLKSMTEMIKNRIRKIDTLARWGGEEFVILLPDTTVNNAARLAEELRESLSQMDIPGVGRVTASFGVAGYCPGDNVDSLVNKADNMMYEAKAAGRNCVRYMNECE